MGEGIKVYQVQQLFYKLFPVYNESNFSNELESIIKSRTTTCFWDEKKLFSIKKKLNFIIQSPVVVRAKHSKDCYWQLPFTQKIQGYSIEGNIDLCFQDSDGWTIVVFKHKSLSNEDNLVQSGLYAQIIEQLIGEFVKEVSFLCLDNNQEQSFFITKQIVQTAIKHFQQMELWR